MDSLKLDKIFNPKSIALIGASDQEGSVGYILMKNLTEMGYQGHVYPVNIRKPEILGKKAYPIVSQIPEIVDLAIIVTPASTVPDILEQCGIFGIKGLSLFQQDSRRLERPERYWETKSL